MTTFKRRQENMGTEKSNEEQAILESLRIFIGNVLREHVNEEVEEAIRSYKGTSFDIRQFKALKSQTELYDYALDRLKLLGEGSSRAAFLLSSGKVLKIAWGKKEAGKAQNRAEVDVYTDPESRPVVARVFDSDPQYRWIVSELVKPLGLYGGSSLLKKRLGVSAGTFDSLFSRYVEYGSEFLGALKNAIAENEVLYTGVVPRESVRKFHDLPHEKIVNFDIKDEFPEVWQAVEDRVKDVNMQALKTFMDGVKHMKDSVDFNTNDISGRAKEHIGISSDGRVVVLDYGFNTEIWQAFYNGNSYQFSDAPDYSDNGYTGSSYVNESVTEKPLSNISLREGGLGGHMSHLHEDINLTFGDLKTIFRTLASHKNTIQVQEKVDGQNVFFTFNVEVGEVRFARNNSHLKTGGMGREDIVTKWAGLPKVQEAYLSAYDVLQSTLSRFSAERLSLIFGTNGTHWYSAEVLTEINPNVINYDGNHIVLHEGGIQLEPGGKVDKAPSPAEYKALIGLVAKVQEDLAKKNWQIHGSKITKLLGMPDNKQLSRGFAAINALMERNGLTNSSTVQDYLVKQVVDKLPEVADWSDEALKALVEYDSGINVRRDEILRALSGSPQVPTPKEVGKIIASADNITKTSLRYLEKILNTLTSQVLTGLHSLLVSSPDTEVARLRDRVSSAVEAANSLEGVPAEKLQEYLNQLGGVENIKNAIEGIVFRWNGKTYKLTYPFSVINQILGLFRY